MPGGNINSNAFSPHVGGNATIFLFIVTLLAFVTETQLTQVLVIWHPILFRSNFRIVCSDVARFQAAIFHIVSTAVGFISFGRLKLSLQLHRAFILCFIIPIAYPVPRHNREAFSPRSHFKPYRRYHHSYVSNPRQVQPFHPIPST